MIPVLLFAGMALAVVLVSRAAKGASVRLPTPGAPRAIVDCSQLPKTKKAIADIKTKTATAKQVKEAFDEAMAAGCTQTANILAIEFSTLKTIEEEEAIKFPKKPKSPISGVSDNQWHMFVRKMKSGRVGSISPKFKLGFFHIGMRRMQDLGFAENVELTDWKEGKAWIGQLVDAERVEDFLLHPRYQYDVFESSMVDHAYNTKNRYGDHIGKEVELPNGEKVIVSWSGLLGLAHQAGLKAVGKWLKDPEDRKKFENTTKMFTRVTGIF